MWKHTLTIALTLFVPAFAQAQTAAPAPADPELGDETPAASTPAAAVAAEASIEPDPALESAEGDPEAAPGPLGLGLEVGAILPQPFSELGTHVSFGLEVGYALPVLEQRLEALFAVAYAPPSRSFDDDVYEAGVSQQELTFSLGPRYRFLARSAPWNVNAALGARLFLLQSNSNGSRDGESFAEFEEQSTQIGLFVALGGEYRLGPGALFLDVDLGWAELPHQITGDGEPATGPASASTGNLAATLGYRLFLL